MDKNTLSNSKMGKLVARLFGKAELTVSDGKVILSASERQAVLNTYGQAFLDRLEAVDVTDDSDGAVELFNAAVEAKTAEATAALQAQISKLQKDVLDLAAEPEPLPRALSTTPVKQGTRVKIDMAAKHNRLAAQMLDPTNPLALSQRLDSNSIDVDDLNAEFEMAMPLNYRLDLLAKRLYVGFEDSKYMTRIQATSDYIASAALMTEVSQQFTSKWTPKGAAKFTPVRIPYRRHKVNVAITPADIISSWLNYLYEQGTDNTVMPITRYITEQHLLPKILEDITLRMIGKGKYVDNSSGVADGDDGSAAVDSMDGYETLLVEGKTDADCKYNFYKEAVDVRTLSGEDLYDYINNFVDAIKGLFATGALNIFCSPEVLTEYKRADFSLHGKYTGEENDGSIRFTNFKLVALQSMYNSAIIFATPKENFVELVDRSKAENCITDVQKVNYDIRIFGEYSLAVGFKVAEAVYAAVPDGYDPADTVLDDDFNVDDDDSEWQHGQATSEATTTEESA